MNASGFYIFCRPHHDQVTEPEAKQLICQLLGSKENVRWDYDPQTTSPNAFIGAGVDVPTKRVALSMHSVPHHHSRMLMEYWQDDEFICSITDLCYEPEKSELLQLFQQVASIVHQNPKPRFRYTLSQQSAMPAK